MAHQHLQEPSAACLCCRQQFDKEAEAADIPDDLEERVRAVLAEHTDLRWDDAIQCVLDPTSLSRVRTEKGKAEQKSGDFSSDGDDGSC